MDINLCWTTRRHLPGIASIEQQVFGYPWSELEFTDFLKHKGAVGLSAELPTDNLLVGYIMYLLDSDAYTIVNLAVHPGYHCLGIGSAMVRWLIGRLSSNRRHTISIYVRERNLGAQLFLKKCGFQATSIHHSFFRHEDQPEGRSQVEDAYLMEFRHQPATAAARLAAAAKSWFNSRSAAPRESTSPNRRRKELP